MSQISFVGYGPDESFSSTVCESGSEIEVGPEEVYRLFGVLPLYLLLVLRDPYKNLYVTHVTSLYSTFTT